MGGARCVFRDCQVSTQRNPKMHFFKLPVRDKDRLEAWLKICGNPNILNVQREKLSNRAVCARHFRYECFMNYKLDRLIPNQTPTLVRISKELAWDLERLDENGDPTMVKLPIPTVSHLIPPKDFECPLGFTEDAHFGRKYVAKRRISHKPLCMDVIKKSKVVPSDNNELNDTDIVELTFTSSAETQEIPEETNEQEHKNKMNTETITNVTTALPDAKHIANDLQLKYDQLKSKFDQLSVENCALQRSVSILETQVQTSKSSSSVCAVSSAPKLSKPQLYNGIKRYLGATMATLLRMEMFGGAERAWKEDERAFAEELLKLGENVYKHCSDEWRFRLPSLRMTRNWLNERNATNDGDPIP